MPRTKLPDWREEHWNELRAATDDRKQLAFDRAIGSIDCAAYLPAQVFRGGWSTFLFFEADRLFAPEFASIAAGLLKADQADFCCFVNFNEGNFKVFESAAMIFVDANTDPSAYDNMLRQGGPAKGWLFGMDRYGVAADRGNWTIYCEKVNDVAAIALRQPSDCERYGDYLRQLHAARIADLLLDSMAPPPFDRLIAPWRRDLIHNYGGQKR